MIEYSIRRATESDIFMHLSRCDTNFIPPLGSRVEVSDYARKIVRKAERFEAWINEELVGMVAAYCNCTDGNVAFITSVSVLPEWQGAGIASRLLANCITHIRYLGFARIELEVSGANKVAIGVYVKIGFTIMGQPGLTQTMKMNLTEEEK